jgi:CRISPR-associated protein Cmr4
MYHKAFGIMETLAPLHVGASAGEESGNLNLIFRDQFTQTGIVPGSSIRGRFRADMRSKFPRETQVWYGHDAETNDTEANDPGTASQPTTKDRTTEALVKFEYASLVWLPVFCPGQPIVWVTCPRWLKRYQQVTNGPKDNQGKLLEVPRPNNDGHPVCLEEQCDRLFFNLGFLDNLQRNEDLLKWVPRDTKVDPNNLVVMEDADIGLIHDMALYRQTRTKLNDDVKKVENFFGFEALPEDSLLVFPIAVKEIIPTNAKEYLKKLGREEIWYPFVDEENQHYSNRELYFGGLESIGCGRCRVSIVGEYVTKMWNKDA